MNNKKYLTIYVDCPWRYRDKRRKHGGVHYPTMTIEELKKLPIQKIVADNAVLFMWATAPLLPEALELIKAWGFVYKTIAFVWVKRNKRRTDSWFWGTGSYTRSNAELCLLATKGKILPRKSRSVHSIIDTPVEAHSKKPDVVRERIVELFGNLPRVELFACQQAKGWDSLGFEIDRKDIREAMQDWITGSSRKPALRRAA